MEKEDKQKRQRKKPQQLKVKRHNITNKQFADGNILFKKCCDIAGIPPTRREASRFRNGKGLAFKFKGSAKEKKNEETK